LNGKKWLETLNLINYNPLKLAAVYLDILKKKIYMSTDSPEIDKRCFSIFE